MPSEIALLLQLNAHEDKRYVDGLVLFLIGQAIVVGRSVLGDDERIYLVVIMDALHEVIESSRVDFPSHVCSHFGTDIWDAIKRDSSSVSDAMTARL